jgi:phosphonate transport system substrate-binding protein
VVFGGPAGAAPEAEKPLVLAFIPQENPEKLLDDITVITAYLAREIGRPVRGHVTQDHAAAVEAMRHGDADIAFMGALPYVLAHHQIGAEVVLGEVYRGATTYKGRLYVRRDSGLTSLADLRGKTVAFADPISESGYIYPLETLINAGLIVRGADPQEFFARVYFAGGYQQAMQAVANGLVDVAGASEFADLLLDPDQRRAVTWIAESAAIPTHGVIVRRDLAPALREAFVSAMLKLNQPDHRYLLAHVYGPDGYVRTSHAAYRTVEAMARMHGLIR